MALSEERRAQLARKGAVEMAPEDWLGLDEIDRKIVEFRVRVGRYVRRAGSESGLTQTKLAQSMGSSQSRVAKLEASADGVGIELLMRAFFACGGTLADLADALRGEAMHS